MQHSDATMPSVPALVLVPENQRPARHRGLMVLVSKGRADKAEAPLAAKAAIDYHLAPPPEAVPPPPAQGLPPDLFRRVCDALLVSGTFVSAENLRSLFADARISPWRHRLPAANDEDSRVRQTVAFLFEQFGADRGHGQTNALVQLLHVLGDHTDPADAQHRELKGLGVTLSTLLTPPLPETGARLEHCWLIASAGAAGSLPQAQALATYCEAQQVRPHIHVVADPWGIQETYDLARALYAEEVPAVGLTAADVIADFTGGVKPMSAGLLLACVTLGAPMQYLYGDRDAIASIPRLVGFAPRG